MTSDTTFSSIAAELVSEQLRLRDDRIAELEAENARLLAAVSPPDGWVFYSADFSMPASGLGPVGNVTFKRDIEGTKSWHALPDEQKEDEDGPPLYASGSGASLYAALCDAGIKLMRGIEKLEGGDDSK